MKIYGGAKMGGNDGGGGKRLDQIVDFPRQTAGRSDMGHPAGAGCEIRPYRDGDGAAFRALNEAWIAKYFDIETKDTEVLGDPVGKILAKGGHIFMAIDGGCAVGCCALIATRPGVFEVAKMTVAESYRGRGLGRRLLAYTIAQAESMAAAELYLETNDSLMTAIHLYEAMGFRHVPVDRLVPSPYARANVSMELLFDRTSESPGAVVAS